MWAVIFIVITMAGLDGDLEACKRKLYVICSNLPCIECREHALEAIEQNNVMSSNNLDYVYFFFINLFNSLAQDPRYRIDVSKVRALGASRGDGRRAA